MSSANISIHLELDAPANLSARDVTESSFTVSWEPAQALIDGYIITYSSSEGSSGEIPVEPGSTSYRLTNLRPAVLYTVYIWAIKGNKASKKISTQVETGLPFAVYIYNLNSALTSDLLLKAMLMSQKSYFLISYNYLFWQKKYLKPLKKTVSHMVN